MVGPLGVLQHWRGGQSLLAGGLARWFAWWVLHALAQPSNDGGNAVVDAWFGKSQLPTDGAIGNVNGVGTGLGERHGRDTAGAGSRGSVGCRRDHPRRELEHNFRRGKGSGDDGGHGWTRARLRLRVSEAKPRLLSGELRLWQPPASG